MPFCPNCGKALQEKEKCTCTATTTTENVTPETQEAQPKKKSKKPVVLAVLIAILVIAAVAVVLVLTNKPHLKPINGFVSAVNKEAGYVELYETLMPDFAAKKMTKVYKALAMNDDYADNLEASENSIMYNYQALTDAFGSWKFKFEVRSESLLEGEDLQSVQNRLKKYYENNLAYNVDSYETTLNDKKLLEEYADNMDITKKEAKAFLQAAVKYYEAYKDVEVGDVYEVKGRFILKVKGDKYDTDTVKFYLANVNGDWFLYSFREGNLEFDSDVYSYTYFFRNYLTSGRYFMHVGY